MPLKGVVIRQIRICAGGKQDEPLCGSGSIWPNNRMMATITAEHQPML